MMLAIDWNDDCGGQHDLLQLDCQETVLILTRAIRTIPETF
jgi:hypothetical protein